MQRFAIPSVTCFALTVLAAGTGTSVFGQTTEAQIDEQFAVASEYFGDGQVQVHSRRDGAAGSTHTVYSFDCVAQTFASEFENDIAPENFPVEATGVEKRPLEKDSVVVPLAQRACEEHGHPLLELKW